MIVAMLALAGTASAADNKAKKPAPKTEAKNAKKPATPPDADAAAGSGSDGSAAEDPEAGLPPHITGPKLVDLGNDTEVEIPAGVILLEKVEAQKIVAKGGDTGENVVAVITKLGASWWIAVEYEGVGYVDDGDADKLDANELLQSYQEGVKQQNERRRTLGEPDMFLDGWSEMPRYEKASHQLVWGLKGHSTNGVSINYFTRILGRPGYLSIDLIDSPENIEKSKVEATAILGATRFKTGQRYEEHKSEDKSSGIGLRALVLGGAGLVVLKAAKVGIFLKLLLFLKGGIKIIILAVGGFFAWIGRGFKRKPKADIMPPPDPGPPPPDPSGPSGPSGPPPSV
jgi:uncharacterized membrane-anchored protein